MAAFVPLYSCEKSGGENENNPPDGYNLVWQDEFNVDGPPEANNWNYEHGFVRNEEDQWYQPENARCENGLLIIEAKQSRKNRVISTDTILETDLDNQ